MEGVPVDRAELSRLLEAVTAIGSDLGLEAVLRNVVEAAVELSGARYGALGVLDERRSGLARFITVGVDEATIRRIGAPPKGLGLLGSVIRDGVPLRLADIAGHPECIGFPQGHPPMRSFLGVPVLVRGEAFGDLYLTDKDGEFSATDEEMVVALASAAGVAIDNARLYEEALRREAAMTAVQEVAGAVLRGAPRDESLHLIARHARRLLRAELATVALPQPDGETLAIEVADGPLWDRRIGERFPIAGSISGTVLATGETVVIEDASQDPRARQPQVKVGLVGPAVWTSLRAGARTFGTLAVGRPVGEPPFTGPELDLVRTFAAQASLVLEQDRARQDRLRLAVLEDQERIARDLHDTVIQRLFATGMALHAASRRVDDPVALERITASVDELDVTIRHIRTVIVGLENARRDHPPGLRSAVLDLCRDAARLLGSEPEVSFDGPLDAVVDDDIAGELLAVLREAVSNVVRHAGAGQVTVRLSARDGALTLVVDDDGVGLSLDRVRAGDGLRNMRSRAERLGGGLEVATSERGGVVLRWQVPVATI